MFIIKVISFMLYAINACIILTALFWLTVFILWLLNCVKKLIVWIFANKISHLTQYPAQKHYRREAVKTGYSMSYYSRSSPVYHYRYKNVFVGTYRKIIVQFSNNFKLKIVVKEEGLLYKKLTSHT